MGGRRDVACFKMLEISRYALDIPSPYVRDVIYLLGLFSIEHRLSTTFQR